MGIKEQWYSLWHLKLKKKQNVTMPFYLSKPLEIISHLNANNVNENQRKSLNNRDFKVLWLGLFVLQRYKNWLCCSSHTRVSISIDRILHCHTWTGTIMERERIPPHAETLVKGNRWFSRRRIKIIIYHQQHGGPLLLCP